MKIFRDLSELSKAGIDRPVCTIGFFDGVHRGHASLVADLLRWSTEIQGTPTVITFSNHPKEVTLGDAPAMLTPVEQRLEYLEKMGIEVVILLTFDEELSHWSPEKFVSHVIQDSLDCRHLLMGFDSAFGAGAQGN
ncbi:MAG: hypothetical protein GWP35_11055, partial [Proteobacteria bacterium]|nr:hypothetical protein [Pseudomonadota bacterium]